MGAGAMGVAMEVAMEVAMGVEMDSFGVVSGWAAAVVASGTVDGGQLMRLASSGGGVTSHSAQVQEPGLSTA